jgi:hypothetical protein
MFKLYDIVIAIKDFNQDDIIIKKGDIGQIIKIEYDLGDFILVIMWECPHYNRHISMCVLENRNIEYDKRFIFYKKDYEQVWSIEESNFKYLKLLKLTY